MDGLPAGRPDAPHRQRWSVTLTRDASGVWMSPTANAGVDYPTEGNEFCFQLEDRSFWFRHRNAVILDVFRRQRQSGLIVDVGAGNGFVARALQDHGFEVVALEPGYPGCLNARRRGVEHVVCSTLEGAGFTTGSVSALGVFDVLEHVRDEASFLAGLGAALLPGGRLYVTVPAYGQLWSGEDVLAGHHRRYTRRSLGAALISAGFHVAYSTYFFLPFPVPLFALRRVPYLLGLDREPDPDAIRRHLTPPSALVTGVADTMLSWERVLLARAWVLPFGTSVLAVAEKG